MRCWGPLPGPQKNGKAADEGVKGLSCGRLITQREAAGHRFGRIPFSAIPQAPSDERVVRGRRRSWVLAPCRGVGVRAEQRLPGLDRGPSWGHRLCPRRQLGVWVWEGGVVAGSCGDFERPRVQDKIEVAPSPWSGWRAKSMASPGMVVGWCGV